MAFQSPFVSYLPQKFTSLFTSNPLIAPLWMPYDMRDYGSVFYRSTTDADILNIVADMIADLNPNFSHYRPDLAVVVTWEKVEQYYLQPDAVR